MEFQKCLTSDVCHADVSWHLPFQAPQSSSPKCYLLQNCQKNLHPCCICCKLSCPFGSIYLEHRLLVH